DLVDGARVGRPAHVAAAGVDGGAVAVGVGMKTVAGDVPTDRKDGRDGAVGRDADLIRGPVDDDQVPCPVVEAGPDGNVTVPVPPGGAVRRLVGRVDPDARTDAFDDIEIDACIRVVDSEPVGEVAVVGLEPKRGRA